MKNIKGLLLASFLAFVGCMTPVPADELVEPFNFAFGTHGRGAYLMPRSGTDETSGLFVPEGSTQYLIADVDAEAFFTIYDRDHLFMFVDGKIGAFPGPLEGRGVIFGNLKGTPCPDMPNGLCDCGSANDLGFMLERAEGESGTTIVIDDNTCSEIPGGLDSAWPLWIQVSANEDTVQYHVWDCNPFSVDFSPEACSIDGNLVAHGFSLLENTREDRSQKDIWFGMTSTTKCGGLRCPDTFVYYFNVSDGWF